MPQAVEFSRRIAEAGWMVITGAASGIMEAGHVGAGREKSIGVNILLPFEQEANPIIGGDLKLMHLKYFFTRKLLFVKESDAVALFPGGFGTQDEGFEVLTLVQTGKSHMFPIVMVDEPGGDYWLRWREYIADELLGRELISPADMSLFKVTDSVDEAVAEVLRLLPRLSQHALRPRRSGAASAAPALRRACCSASATSSPTSSWPARFEQTEALPEEANDTHIATSAASALSFRPPQSRPAATDDRRDQSRRIGERPASAGWLALHQPADAGRSPRP